MQGNNTSNASLASNNSSSSSSSSSHHHHQQQQQHQQQQNQSAHSVLLTTVMELRNDLERTMSKMHVLDDQNHLLTQNYQVVKEELIETRRKYNEARDNYMTTVAEKLEAERQNEAFMERIKIQLTEKTKEFEQLRDKFAPQDIDYVRIKVQEELEIPHRQRLQAMEAEIQKQKDLFFALRRENERCKAEYETYSQNQQREVGAIREERDIEVQNLRDQITRMQENDHVPDKDDLIRAHILKIHELKRSVDTIRDEARVMRSERDATIELLDQLRSKHAESLVGLRDKLAIAEAERAGAEERYNHLSSDADRKDAQLRSARQTTDDSAALLDHARRQQTLIETQLISLRGDHTREIEDTTASFHAERVHLQEQIDALSDRLYEREELIRRAQRETSEMQVRAEGLESEMRRVHAGQIQECRKRCASVEVELADTLSKCRAYDSQKQQLVEMTAAEIDTLKSEVARVKREKDVLHDRVREFEHSSEAERRKTQSIRRDLSSKVETVDTALKEITSRANSLETQLVASKSRETDLQSATISAQVESERRTVEQALLIEAIQKEAHFRLDSLKTDFKERLDSVKQKLKAALLKEKKRADAYKEKALEAHSRVKAMSASQNLATFDREAFGSSGRGSTTSII